MVILDWIIIAVAAIVLIVGFCKGLLYQILSLLALAVAIIGTAHLFKYPYLWMSSLIANETTRKIVALIATYLVLSIVCGIIVSLLTKAFGKLTFLKGLDTLLGGILGVVIVYTIVSVIVALYNGASEETLTKIPDFIKNQFSESWIIANIYKNNFVGDWVWNLIATKFAA